MATEVGTDFAHIQDEDMLRKMWQQTEDFGKKKEIRMRMYKLREQRLKEFYTTGEMIQTETTSKRSSTRTHTESITDQGFMTMKTKEIRDSESPTEDYQRQSNTNKNYYVSSKIDESDGNKGIVEIEQTTSLKPNEEYTQSSLQTSMSSSTSSKWKSSQTTISVSEEIQNSDVNLNSKFIVNEQNNEGRQLAYDTSYNKSDTSNIDSNVTESISTSNLDNIKRDDNNQYSNVHQTVIEVYTSNGEQFKPVSENISNKDSNFVENTYISNISSNKSEHVEIATDSKIINELQKLDSYLSTQQSTTDSSTKSNSVVSNDDKIIKTVDDQVIDASKNNIEDHYITTHQHSYQPPRISVDLSPSHEAFARSLRSTPDRSSPSPCRERTSPERRFKSASPERRFKSTSPEKYRASPEKSGSPSKSLNYSSRRKLSSTHTKGLSKKRSITPTRGKKYDSSDDSDCSGATHGTYDKYKDYDAKRTLFKEETKITSASKYGQKSPSTSPVRRQKSPGYSSEGSVGKEVRKSSSKVKNSSHECSPERSAFKPIKNYKTIQTQNVAQDNKITHITQQDNVYTNNYTSTICDDKHLIKVIKPEIGDGLNENKNIEPATINIENDSLNSKNKSIQEKFIVEEQVCTSAEQIDNAKTITQLMYNNEINKTPREKSPSKSVKKENNTKQEEFIETEKSNVEKQSTTNNDVITVKQKEKSPLKEVKPTTKDTKTYPSVKSPENISKSSDSKSVTPSKKTISAIPSSIKKVVPSTLEKTPSKKNLIHKDSKDSLLNKTVKKDLSREKMDIKITRSDSKTLMHKNSKERITPKTIIKKPSQELLVDKKITISSRQKVTSPETKTKTLETIKVLEKKDSKIKLKPSISPQSSQKKLGIVKLNTDTKTVIDSKRTIGNTIPKRTPSSSGIKPRTTHTAPKSDINETPSKVTKPNSNTISISSTAKPEIKKTAYSNLNKTIKVEVTKNVEQKQKDLEDELPPDNFESDTDLDDSTSKPKYIKNISSNSSTSSSSSEEDDEEGDDLQKIKDIDNIRIEAEEEYGKKMTNKDALLNVIVQLPPSSRESSPEYSARFGQPYCSVSDDASMPRYADVVSEPEDVNDYRLYSNRYDVVTDLDEENNVTVADRVSKFLNNVNKQEEIQKTTEIPQSPQAVRKTKQLFESIAKGQIEETDVNEVIESETTNIETEEVHDLSKHNNTQSSISTRKISGASDYKSRKDFFENKKNNEAPEKVLHLTPNKIIRSSSIKDRRASFEKKIDKKTPLKDKTNVPSAKSPESKNSSPDRSNQTPIKISNTETFDVKVEEINRSRRLSGSKTVKDRTATFEKNEPTQKSFKENKTSYRQQAPSTPFNTSKNSETRVKSATVADTKTSDRVSTRTVTSPEKTPTTDSMIKANESSSRKSPSKSPDRKLVETPKINSSAKSPERSVLTNTKDNYSLNHSARDTISSSSKQRAIITTAKTEFGVTVKNTSTPKTTSTTTTTKSISVHNVDDEVQIEEIFDLHVLEIMLEKAVGYDRRRRIRAQIRVVKRQLETNSGKVTNTTTRVPKNYHEVPSFKSQKQSNVTVQKTEYVKKAEVEKERSVSPQKSYANPIGNSRSSSPQKTVRSVVDTRSPLPTTQKAARPIERTPSPQKRGPDEKVRSPSPIQMSVEQKLQDSRLNKNEKASRNSTFTSTATTVTKTQKAAQSIERSPSPQKTVTSVEKVPTFSSQKSTPIEKVRSPSPQKKTSTVVQHQQDSRLNKNEKSSRNSTFTSTSTTVTKTTKVKSEQVSSGTTNLYQEQNVTDLITSSYGVGPTDDNGRPLFGLRALRKSNATQSVVNSNDSSSSARRETDSLDAPVSDQKLNRSFGLKALQSENTTTVQESTRAVYQTTTVQQSSDRQKGGVDQLITDHKGKPLYGLKALQSIGKSEEEPIYDDMPEPPVSPQLKDLVLKHEKHAKESSKLESQPRQKPKAKFRDSFILDNKDEGLYSTFEENGYTEPNQKNSFHSIIKNTENDQNNETVVKSKSQSTVFQSKSVMRSDGSGNVSVTQDFLKGEVSSVNDQEPSGKLTRGHYTYQSPDNLDAKKGIAKVTTVTTAIGKDTGPQITEITEDLSDSDHIDGNKVVKRSRTNDKFETIQKRFSQESFNQDSRRSSKELNGHEKTEESPQSTPRSSLVRGDSIKALQHKFQQATVSSSLKQNKSAKSDSSSTTRQVEEKTVTTKVNATKNSGTATSFLDNNSRVTGVQDVLTRMRNADLVVESGDTNEDTEARALLNKFLGASVILHGMEQGNKSPASITTTSSATLVNQVEKQRAQKSPVIRKNVNEQELDNIWDEKQLQILLESCPDYDQRRKIRARLRQIMAEHKACTDVVAQAGLTDGTTSNGKNEVTETNSTSVSSKTGTGSYVKTEVHTRTTTSSNRLTKANSVSSSPFAKFQQLERQNSAPNSQTRPCYKFTDPALARSASSIKDRLLNWVKAQTKEYKNLQVTNFSTCWSDGLAFCALIHHFYPEAFDYDKLTPEKRRENFEIAFKVAEDEAGIAPLLDVEDMVVMRKPDWKCVFTYVQTFYRRFHNDPRSVKPSYFE